MTPASPDTAGRTHPAQGRRPVRPQLPRRTTIRTTNAAASPPHESPPPSRSRHSPAEQQKRATRPQRQSRRKTSHLIDIVAIECRLDRCLSPGHAPRPLTWASTPEEAVDHLTTAGHLGASPVVVTVAGQRIMIDQRDIKPGTSSGPRFDGEVFVNPAGTKDISRYQQQHRHMVPGHANPPLTFMHRASRDTP